MHVRGGSMWAGQVLGKDFKIIIVIKQHIPTCMDWQQCGTAVISNDYKVQSAVLFLGPLVLLCWRTFLWSRHGDSHCFFSECSWTLGKFAKRSHKMVITSRWQCRDNLTNSPTGSTHLRSIGVLFLDEEMGHTGVSRQWYRNDRLVHAATASHSLCRGVTRATMPAAAVNELMWRVRQINKGPSWGREGRHHPFSQLCPGWLRGSTCSFWDSPSKLFHSYLVLQI